MAKLTITVGPARFDIENGDAETVGEILAEVRAQGLLNIPAGATPVLNGAAVGEDAMVEDGDELAFNKAAGEKGIVLVIRRKA
jgi:hypothetical protein